MQKASLANLESDISALFGLSRHWTSQTTPSFFSLSALPYFAANSV
jgi:hypothetical protein